MNNSSGAPASPSAASLGNPLFDDSTTLPPLEPLLILDTTLRDGEQSPGVTLDQEGKLAIAHQLARLRVDIIEAGFPFASPGDFKSVQAIAEQVDGPIIAGLSRVWPGDIKACADALKPAQHARIHTFVGTSPLHRQALGLSAEEVLTKAVEMTAYAKTFRKDVEFSPMDASRTEPAYLVEIVAATIAAGATTINLPDTVGFSTPFEWQALLTWLYGQIPALNDVVVSVHCHNDLGLATANSLVSIKAGARQIEVCVNGIGERAGNAALEEIALATKLHPEVFRVETRLDHSEIYHTSRMVSKLTGMVVQPNHPVVGANAFAHHSGIHQDGVLKNPRTFEIIDPLEVGAGSTLVLGKLSGRHALQKRLASLGYPLEGEDLKLAFMRFKEIADRKREITEEDLESIATDQIQQAVEEFWLEHLQVSTGINLRPTATVRIHFPTGDVEAVALGDGPIDATFAAINSLVKIPNELEEFSVQSITKGIDALGQVNVRLRSGQNLATGQGSDTDIVVASAHAYIRALNKLSRGPSSQRMTPESSSAAEPKS